MIFGKKIVFFLLVLKNFYVLKRLAENVIAQLLTLLFGVQLGMTAKLMYHTTANNKPTMALLPTMHHFIRAKLDSYTIRYSVFSINHAYQY